MYIRYATEPHGVARRHKGKEPDSSKWILKLDVSDRKSELGDMPRL